MPDDQNQDSQDQNSQNNQSGNSPSYGGGGKKICLGADNGCTQEHCSAIQKGLEDCGNTVKFTTIDPNQESHMQGSGCDFNVFFCNGVAPATMWSFRDAIKAGSLPFTIFAFLCCEPYHNPNEPTGTLASIETIRAEPFEPEHDAGQFMNASSNSSMASEKSGNGTLGEWIDQNSQYVGLCAGKDPQDLAQQICSGACGGGGSSGGGTSGEGAKIKDKTFEHCIRRICAATDSVFIVEGNAAILFPYTDWMAFILEAKLQTISAAEMDPDVFEMEYNSEGFYNKVVGWWGDVEVPDRYIKDDKTGKIIKNPETKAELSEIGKKLTAKYGTSDYASIINKESGEEYVESLEEYYKNKKIGKTNEVGLEHIRKDGDITTKETNLANGGVQLAKQYDPLVDVYGELEKRITTPYPDQETAEYALNALLIQYVRDFNNKCRVRTLNTQKYIGGTFYVVENPFTKKQTLFYLNGYTIRTQKDEPLYIDLDFRYGPEGAEELLDYQFLTGGSGSGGSTGIASSSEEQIWMDAAKCKWAQDQEDCSTQDPTTAKKHYDDYTAKGQEVHFDCYGMSAYLYYRFNNEAQIPCQVVGDSSHHVVMLDRGQGFVSTKEEYRKYNMDYLFKWRDDQNTAVVLAAPGGKGNTKSAGAGGNTA